MLTAIASLVLLCSSQTPPDRSAQTISYNTVAKPLNKILSDLTKKSGVPIESSSPLGLEVFAISAEDVSLQDLLKQIARAARAEVKTNDFGIYLNRSSEAIAQDKASEEALTQSWILKCLEETRKRVSQRRPIDSSSLNEYVRNQANRLSEAGSIDYKFLDENSPVNNLRDQLLLCIEPDVLAKLRPNETVVYSTKPNRLQRRFAGNWSMALSQFSLIWPAWVSTMKDQAIDGRLDQEHGLRSGLNPDKALLCCMKGRGSIRCDLKIVAANGAVLSDIGFGASATLNISPSANAWSVVKPDLANPGTPVAFSALANALSDNQRSFNIRLESGKDAPEAPSAVNLWALQPETYDPLSLHPSELAFHLAKKSGKNLVALLPDSSVSISYQSDQTDAKLKATLERSASLRFEEDGNWLIGTPIRPYFTQTHRLNRSDIGPLFRHANQTPAVSIEELAQFVYKYKAVRLLDTEINAFSFAVRNNRSLNTICQNQDILCLFGSLAAGQRQALVAGKSLEYRTLSDEQKRLFSTLLLNQQNLHSVSASGLPKISGLESVYSEPTEAIQDGIPGNAAIELAIEGGDVILSSDSRHEPLPIEVVAQGLYNAENNESPIRVVTGINLSTPVMFGKEQKYRFKIVANALLHKEFELSMLDYSPDQKPVFISNLPKPIYDAIMKRLEDIRRDLGGIQKQGNPRQP